LFRGLPDPINLFLGKDKLLIKMHARLVGVPAKDSRCALRQVIELRRVGHMCFRSGEIRILDATGKIERTIAFSEADRML